jgi:hypothetical protein
MLARCPAGMPEYGLRDGSDGDKASTGPDRRRPPIRRHFAQPFGHPIPARLNRSRAATPRVDCPERQMILMRAPGRQRCALRRLRPGSSRYHAPPAPWSRPLPDVLGGEDGSIQRCAPVLLRPCGVRCPRSSGADIGDRPRGHSATLIVPRASPIGHEVDDHLMQVSGIAQDRPSGSNRLLDADAPGNGRAQQPAAPRQ